MNDLPDPPWRVYARKRQRRVNRWWVCLSGMFVNWDNSEHGEFAWPEMLCVKDHPRNDPEAVEIIERAKDDAY